jgi:O-antigen/teichoic acid export membrane protein
MKVSVARLTINILVMAVAFAVALFLSAGTLAWWAAWAYLVLMFGFTIAISIWLFKFNPDLLAERLSGIGKPGQKTWDKVFLVLTAVALRMVGGDGA